MATFDHMNAVNSNAELITQLEGIVAIANQTKTAINPHTITLLLNAARATTIVQAHAPNPTPTDRVDQNFASDDRIDAISANARLGAGQKQGLRQLLARHGVQTPPVGKKLAVHYLDQQLSGLPMAERLRVKVMLHENSLV